MIENIPQSPFQTLCFPTTHILWFGATNGESGRQQPPALNLILGASMSAEYVVGALLMRFLQQKQLQYLYTAHVCKSQ